MDAPEKGIQKSAKKAKLANEGWGRALAVATDASDVFDDAIPNGDQTATSGTLR